MDYFAVFMKLIPFLIALVQAAEKVYTQRESGFTKKQAVKEGLGAMYDGAQAISTGGQANTLKILDPLVDAAIDAAAGILFPQTNTPQK